MSTREVVEILDLSGPSSDEFPPPPEDPIQIIPSHISQPTPRKHPRSGPCCASTPIMTEAAAANQKRLAGSTPQKKRPRRRRRFPPMEHRFCTRPQNHGDHRIPAAPTPMGTPTLRFQDHHPMMPASSDSVMNMICMLTQRPSRWQISPLPQHAAPWMTTPGVSYNLEHGSSWNDSGSGCTFATDSY